MFHDDSSKKRHSKTVKHFLKVKEYTIEEEENPFDLMSPEVRYFAYMRKNEETVPPPVGRPPVPFASLRRYPSYIPLDAREQIEDPRTIGIYSGRINLTAGEYTHVAPSTSIDESAPLKKRQKRSKKHKGTAKQYTLRLENASDGIQVKLSNQLTEGERLLHEFTLFEKQLQNSGEPHSPLPPPSPSEALDQEALDLIIQQTLEENTLLQTDTDFDIIDWLTLDAVGTPPDAGLFIPPPEEQMRSA